MAFPAAPTESGGSKLHFLETNANTAAGWFAVVNGTTGTGANLVGAALVATHEQATSLTAPGGVTMGAGPVVCIAGNNAGTVRAINVDGSGYQGVNIQNTVTVGTHAVTQSGAWSVSITGTPTVSVSGTVTVSVSGTVTVGTHAVSQSGTWNIGTVTAVTAITNALPAGTNVLGGVFDDGWNTAGKTVQRGLATSVTATTEQTLLAADAANLYNIHQLVVSYYSGSSAPAAMRKLSFKLGAGGTVFHIEYIPPTLNVVNSFTIPLPKEPVRSAVNQAIVCQLDGALGTSGEYSAMVLAYKSAS